MKIEIDQSGKIADTKVATVLAFSDGITYSILVKATTKRKLVKELRTFKDAHVFYLQLFAVLIFILIKDFISQIQSIHIDQEYPGRTLDIKGYLINLFKISGMIVDPLSIHFLRIGKHSRAHLKALESFRKKDADRVINYSEVVAYFAPNKKDQDSYRKG